MYHIRTTKTDSGATAIQIVRYENRKMIVAAHIGSAHTASEIKAARLSAKQWIDKASKQPSLFPADKKSASTLISLQKCHYLGFYYNFINKYRYKSRDSRGYGRIFRRDEF